MLRYMTRRFGYGMRIAGFYEIKLLNAVINLMPYG